MRSAIFMMTLFLALPALAADEGETCDKELALSDDGRFQCLKTGDWVEHTPRLENGVRGDPVITAGCGGTVSSLLREVGQSYSHSGLMLDPFTVRHSTGSERWLMRFPDGGDWQPLFDLFDATGEPLDGLQGDALRFLWPGTITQGVRDALYGAYVLDTEITGEEYWISAFDVDGRSCDEDLPKNPPMLIKQRIAPEARQGDAAWSDAEVDALRRDVADAMEEIDGHYRFGVYTNAATPVPAPDDLEWLPGSEGTVCSQAIWRAARNVGVHLEGVLEESDCLPGDDACVPGTSMSNPEHDGLYDYSEAERKGGAELLKILFVEAAQEALEDMDLFAEWIQGVEDPLNQVANQVVNCFAFDWCDTDHGPTDLDGNAVDCDEDDPRNSECWTSPGKGRAVSPDDMLAWDGPDGDGFGIFGAIELAQPQLPYFVPEMRWTRVDGMGAVEGTVTDGAMFLTNATLRIDGRESGVTGAGDFAFPAVEAGPQLLQACAPIDPHLWWVGEYDIEVPANGTLDMGELQLTSAFDCPYPELLDASAYRLITLSGSMTVTDDEWWPDDDEVETVDLIDILLPGQELDDAFVLCLDSPNECPSAKTVDFEVCVGEEVRAELAVTVRLQPDRTVEVTSDLELYEGATGNCQTTLDKDAHQRTVVEQSTSDETVFIEQDILNEDWEEDDRIQLSLEVTNEVFDGLP